MNVFTVREYAFLSVAHHNDPPSHIDHAYITQSAFDYLCDLSGSFSKHGTKFFEMAGRKKIKLDQYVGVIETPCGTCIEILPKHIDLTDNTQQEIIINEERILLQNLLRVSLHLSSRKTGAANLTTFKQPLHEWIIQQFLECLEQLIKQGLRFDYNRIEQEKKYIKGQLQHIKHMRQPPTKKHIFPIEHDVYVVNRAENRLIKTALNLISKKTSYTSNWKRALEIEQLTDEIPISSSIQEDFKHWQNNRLMKNYQEIKPWTELILGEYMPVSTPGKWRGISLLFPMERLFENYVAYFFKKTQQSWHVQTQHGSHYLCSYQDKPMFKLKPDILLTKMNTESDTLKLKVIDTKWKLLDFTQPKRFGLNDQDMQQMFAYSALYLNHAHEVLMIYPARKNFFSEQVSGFKFNYGNTKLRIIPFELDITPHSQKGKAFLNSIFQLNDTP